MLNLGSRFESQDIARILNLSADYLICDVSDFMNGSTESQMIVLLDSLFFHAHCT